MKLSHFSRFIWCIFICLGAAFDGEAEDECSNIIIENNESTQIVIHQMNGYPLFNGSKTFNHLLRSTNFKINPGQYYTIGYAQREKGTSSSDIVPLFFTLDIDVNKKYTLKPVISDGVIKDIEIDVQSLNACSESFDIDVSDFVDNEKRLDVYAQSPLTEKVQSLFAEVLQSFDSARLTGTSPEGYSTDIGVSFSKKQPKNKFGIEVLSVTPFSPASIFGLRSGDIVLEINSIELSRDFQTNVEIFNHFLVQSYSNDLTMKIQRQQKHLKLVGEFVRKFVPRFSIKVNNGDTEVPLIKYLPIGNVQRYQLDNIVAKLSTQWRELYPDITEVNLILNRRLDQRFGVEGTKYQHDNVSGILVNMVKQNSIAERLGVLKNDILLSINNASPLNFTLNDNVQNTDHSKVVTVRIIRDGQKITLERYVGLNVLPKIELSISLESELDFIDKRQQQIAAVKKLRLRRYVHKFNEGNPFEYNFLIDNGYNEPEYNNYSSNSYGRSRTRTTHGKSTSAVKNARGSTATTSVRGTHRSISTDN